MYKTITFSDAQWGYLNRLRDWSGGKAAEAGETPDGRHALCSDFDEEFLLPGVTDTSLARKHGFSGYGPVRPPDESERELWDLWEKCRMQRLDYYISLLNGSPDPDSGSPYLYNQLCVWGEDEDGAPIPRQELLAVFKTLNLHAHHDFWFPVQIFHGVNRGWPEFNSALKAHTDIGERWYGATTKLSGKLPDGYQWDNCGRYGVLHIEEES